MEIINKLKEFIHGESEWNQMEMARECLYTLQIYQLQDILKSRGVVDIKFHVEGNPSKLKYMEDLIEVLTAYVNGDYTEAAPFGDSVIFDKQLTDQAPKGDAWLSR